jgi:hypothetical protein
MRRIKSLQRNRKVMPQLEEEQQLVKIKLQSMQQPKEVRKNNLCLSLTPASLRLLRFVRIRQ